MQKLENGALLELQGGQDAKGGACVIFLTEMIIIVGVGFFGGGMLGAFTLGLAVSALKSDASPC
jgi:hypothetical protein